MRDIIYRQDAIDIDGLDEEIRCEMCKNPMHTDRGCDGNCQYDEKLYERIMQILDERIKPLPSAQPEQCKDAVSKAKVLEAYADLYDVFDDNKEIQNELHKVFDRVNNLPPAQPEQAVKDCRTCKHGKYNDYHDTYFCYNAEDCSNWDKWETSAQPEYKPVTAEDFAKTMSQNTLYGFKVWHREVFTLIEEMGFVICKKTM